MLQYFFVAYSFEYWFCHTEKYKSLDNYDALDECKYNNDDNVARCLDVSFEEHEEIDYDMTDDLLRMSNASHSYLSPSTKRLHQDLLEASCDTNQNEFNEESMTASKKNMIQNITWIMKYSNPIKNPNCAQIIRDLEQSIMAAKLKLKIQSEVFFTLSKTGLSYPSFAKKNTHTHSKAT